MQTYSDVLRMPISTIRSEQGPALGSAIHAAVAAGAYPDTRVASDAMGSLDRASYTPDPAAADAYDALYAEYLLLHDWFGRGGNDVMHRLKAISREARGGSRAPVAEPEAPAASGGSAAAADASAAEVTA